MAGPTQATVKRLFAVSGNRCAFPDCLNPLVEPATGIVVAEICHIKARSQGWPRYDASQSDEERHGFDNLILMCGTHHKVIDSDAEAYPVAWLRDLKAAHEARYVGGAEPSEGVTRQFLLAEVQTYLQRAAPAFEARTRARVQRLYDPHAQPYKFLYAFDVEDADIFFGRSAATEALRQTVLRARLTVLHARSGAGKTSLLNAGLSPHLISEGRLPVYARAYDDPVEAIKEAIAPRSLEPWPELLPELGLQEFLGLVYQALSRATRELVLILDQFEEFFVFWPVPEHRQPFIDALADCHADASLPLRFILSLRKDYYSDLADLKDRIPTIFYNEYRLDTMTREEAQLAITEPVTRRGRPVTYEPGLLATLLDDLARGGMELPHLQIICTRLYETLPPDGTSITLASYEQLGRAEGVLGRYLNHVLEQFPEDQERLARRALKELVSSEATKRVVSLSVLAERTGAETGLLGGVLRSLVDARLLSGTGDGDTAIYELAHEHLVREIETWFDPADLAFKQAEELLARELASWRASTTPSPIPLDRLERLFPHRARFPRSDAKAWECLLYSVLEAGHAVMDWVETLGEPSQPILLAALDSPSEEVRLNAIQALGQIDHPGVLEPLLAALQHDDPAVRAGAARALGRSGEDRVLQPLITALKDRDPGVRAAAALALGQVREEAAIPHLVALLPQEDYEVNEAVRKVLFAFREPAVEPLLAELKRGDERMRQAATVVLGQLRDLVDVEPLVAATQDPAIGVRLAALDALAGREDDRARAAQLAALQDSDPEVRQHVLYLLEQHWDSWAVEPLLPLLHDPIPEIRAQVAGLLGRSQDTRALQPLLDTLSDVDGQVRRQAVGALGLLGDAGAADQLIDTLEDAEETVRLAAAEALGQLGDGRALGPLMDALRSGDSALRAGAASGLGKLASVIPDTSVPGPIVDALLIALQDTVPQVRTNAARALGRFRTPRAVEPLIAALEDADADEYVAVVQALGEIGDPSAAAPIIDSLEYAVEDVQWAAVEALEKLAGVLDADALLRALQHESSDLRRWAAASLGGAGDPRAVEPLLAALGDQEDATRTSAATSLARLAAACPQDVDLPGITQALIAALQEGPEHVRYSFAEALGTLGRALTGPELLEPLLPGLLAALQDGDADLRWHAIRTLRDLLDPGSGSSVPTYLEDGQRDSILRALLAALDDPSEHVLDAAAAALGHLGDARAIEPLLATVPDDDDYAYSPAYDALKSMGDPAVEPLIHALEHGREAARPLAALVLGELRDPRAFPALCRALRDGSASVRYEAAGALGNLGEVLADTDEARKAVDLLLAILEDPADDEMHAVTAWSLGRLGDRRAVEPLLAALHDPDDEVCQLTIRALGQLGDARAVKPLIAALQDREAGAHPDIAIAAAHALGELADARAIDPLLVALRDPVHELQGAAAGSLANFYDHRVVEALIATLEEPGTWPGLKLAATTTLGQLAPRAVAPGERTQIVRALIAALQAPDLLVRKEAAFALSSLRDDRAGEPLLAALQAEDDYVVREQLIRALGELRHAPAIDALATNLTHPTPEVRQAAIWALGQIGAVITDLLLRLRSVAAVEQGLGDRDAAVRQEAAAALAALGDTPNLPEKPPQ